MACYKPRPMHRAKYNNLTGFVRFGMALVAATIGCQSGGVGDPCIPDDEFIEQFNGFSLGEVNVESRSFQCETRVCLVNKFQGRVSCPYGTNGSNPDPMAQPTVAHDRQCQLPGFTGYVEVPVPPQRTERSPEVAVYCSCRCNGDDPNARYCECPSGFECADIVPKQSGGTQEGLAGSYCIRAGSNVDPATVSQQVCKIPEDVNNPGVDELTCGDAPDRI